MTVCARTGAQQLTLIANPGETCCSHSDLRTGDADSDYKWHVACQSGVAENNHFPLRSQSCQEYLLQTDRVIYRIRPRDEKHPVLLTVGEKAQFRIEKDKMKLRVEDLDGKERDYFVVSMTPRDTNAITTASKWLQVGDSERRQFPLRQPSPMRNGPHSILLTSAGGGKLFAMFTC